MGFNQWDSFAIAGSPYATSFSLDSSADYSEFTALYDQYRITEVKMHFFPMSTSIINTTISTAPVNFCPRVVVCADYDDSSTPSSFNQLRQYSTARVYSAIDRFTYAIKPALSVAAYETVSTTAYAPSWGLWVSTADPNAKYYGFKGYMENTGASGPDGAFGFRVEAEFTIECRMAK